MFRLVFSPDGGQLLATHGDRATAWRVLDGAHLFPVGFVTSVSFSPDGQTIATSWADGTTRLIDVATRTAVGPALPGIANESDLASFLPDGSGVMVVSLTGAGFLWDVDPEHWGNRACTIAGRQLTREEWQRYLPGRPLSTGMHRGGSMTAAVGALVDSVSVNTAPQIGSTALANGPGRVWLIPPRRL